MSIVDHGARTHPPPCALCSPVGRPTRFQLLIWFLTPPCSYVSSSVHSHLAAAKIQTPREGGGFGIFPTVDERQVRFVRYVLITPEDKARVRPPEHLHTCSSAVRAGWRRTGGPPATRVVNEHSRWEAGCHQAPPDASFRVRRRRIKPPFPKREEATIVGIVGLSGTGRVRPLGL